MDRKFARSPTDTIMCECGAEIVLLPDAKAMDIAIELHVSQHLQKLKRSCSFNAEAERLRDALIAQVFIKASKSENDQPLS